MTRSRGANTASTIAIDVGCVAAPIVWAMVRQPMSCGAFCDVAVSTAASVASPKPMRKTLRWPRRSPSLPSTGRARAEISSGREMTHAIVVSDVSKSRAISPSETVSRVTGNDVANIPARAVNRTQR